MNFEPYQLYHIYNQGNNRQSIFHHQKDYETFLNMAMKNLPQCSSVVAYCLMPNHFHFMVGTDERVNEEEQQGALLLDPLTNTLRRLLSGYARIFNQRYDRSGSLFRQKTKIKCLTEDIAMNNNAGNTNRCFNCFHYIHQNPVRAKLVNHLADWQYSSYYEYAGLERTGYCNKELATAYCEYNPDSFIRVSESVIPENFIFFE
jgi:putative transposase